MFKSILVAGAMAQQEMLNTTISNQTSLHPADEARTWDEEIAASGATLTPKISEAPDFINHSMKGNLPKEIQSRILYSNNCIGIIKFKDRIYAGWRSSYVHFATKGAQMLLMSAKLSDVVDENGQLLEPALSTTKDVESVWRTEDVVALGNDVREPYFLQHGDDLFFYFFEAGTNPVAFEPQQMWRKQLLADGTWSDVQPWGQQGEVAWQLNYENSTAYAGSFNGATYDFTDLAQTDLMINKSSDAINFSSLDERTPVSYRGGGSEVGWAFDLQGHFYGAIRNEDGDESGWGLRIVHGEPETPANWEFDQDLSAIDIVESPRMFRHGNDLYLIGRTDPSGHYWNKHGLLQSLLPPGYAHTVDMALYSGRNHGNAMWKLNKDKLSLTKVADLPGCGDTSFASVVRLAKNRFLIANYSSPRDRCENWSWIHGQVSPSGTAVHMFTVDFE